MRVGKDFEVSKEVYERAKANRGYMAEEDKEELFSESIRYGYGLYCCVVREVDGKYICSYETGDSCRLGGDGMNYNDGKTIADTKRERILAFVSMAFDEAVKDGTNDMTITLHITPQYEEFSVDKSGIVRGLSRPGGEKQMSVSLWRWTEECDHRPCPGDCDECEIAQNYNLEDDDSPCQNCGE